MMKIIITHQTNSISFEIEKNLPEHEAFEVVHAFTVSAFENLPDPLVYSLAGAAEPFHLQGPRDWKEGLQKHFRGSVICLTIVEPKMDSDSESDSYVLLTKGNDEKSSEQKTFSSPVAKPAENVEKAKEEAPIIEDYDAEDDLEDKEGQQEAEEPLSMKQRVMQFIVEIGSEGLQNIAAVVHSLVTEGNADLGDAIRTAIETSEKAANHPLTQDLLAIMDVYIQKFQNQCNWHALLSQFNIDHIVKLIPGIVEALTRSLEGANNVELDLSPLIGQFCPMLGQMAQCIPRGQERVFQANPMNPFGVFEEARESLEQEFAQPVHQGITCDGCNASPIVGVRYKSVLNANYDLCEECEKDHDPKDPLIKIKTPVHQMDMLPGLQEFRHSMMGGRRPGRGFRGCRRGARGQGRGSRGCGRGMRAPGCGMFRKMFKHAQQQGFFPNCGDQNECNEHMKEMQKRCKEFMSKMANCGDNKECNEEMKKHCQEKMQKAAEFFAKMRCANQEPPRFPENRRDPARSAQEPQDMVAQKQDEVKQKQQEVREAKAKVKALKKEVKACKKEMKKAKKSLKKFDAEVVGHLDTDEKSVQKPGSSVVKTWKVKNTGTEAWGENTMAVFLCGNKSLVVPGFEFLQVEPTLPGHVAYIHCMLQAPDVQGTYSLCYRLANMSGKFGSKMMTEFEVVAENQGALNESTSTIETAITFTSEPGSNSEIPKEIEDHKEEVVASVAEPEIPAPSAPFPSTKTDKTKFKYAVELEQLKSMGFEMPEETLESVLVATKGDIAQAISLLM